MPSLSGPVGDNILVHFTHRRPHVRCQTDINLRGRQQLGSTSWMCKYSPLYSTVQYSTVQYSNNRLCKYSIIFIAVENSRGF